MPLPLLVASVTASEITNQRTTYDRPSRYQLEGLSAISVEQRYKQENPKTATPSADR